LLESEGVTAEALSAALEAERLGRERVGEVLVRLGATTPEAVARCLALQLGIPYVDAPIEPESGALEAVRPGLSRTHHVLPLSISPKAITLAMADPLDLVAMDDVQFQTGRRVDPVVSTTTAISDALERHDSVGPVPSPNPLASRPALSTLVDALPPSMKQQPVPPGEESVDHELERAVRRAPVVRLVDRIIRRAIEDGASDIHVEETGKDVRVRFRLDGRLEQALDVPSGARRAILSRIKVLAGMDIAIRRRAQDGRVAFRHEGRGLSLRVSTLPVNGGEKAVVRILDAESAPRDLSALGMADQDLSQLRSLLRRGEGVILAAGPTGSGKSTTLFAALSEIDRDHRNVVTVEDPVEYRLPGASQVQVERRAGLGFAEALRAILRQDPDVVMVGEIRDRETAEIAMAAAVTGHLVLSTIHTTDAPGAVTRLLHMGVPPFLVAGGLAGVVAQRLVRRSCDACRARGCAECRSGLRGRTGVYQVLRVTDAMRDEISVGGSSARLRRLARDAGMRSMESDARRAVAAGLTTPHEVSGFLSADPSSGVRCSTCSTAVPFGALACPGCGARRRTQCVCGHLLERAWRFCPSCVRPTHACA
ncbi:MAG: ATPase, T2SS/T4P/T4SS family, partial [Gemmatimonadota bacterium]|nr:ATPase, T2SS/T4P/T4SS family [Gemmatimonadota bacterium]